MRPVAIVGAGVALIASGLTGCGGDTSTGASGAGVGSALAAPINLADCTDWQQASADERLGTIEQIRNYVGGGVAGTEGSGVVLDDERAYEVLDNFCQNEFARGFKLYKLYSRAAAFSGE